MRQAALARTQDKELAQLNCLMSFLHAWLFINSEVMKFIKKASFKRKPMHIIHIHWIIAL